MNTVTERELAARLRKARDTLWSIGALGDPYAMLLRGQEDPYRFYDKIRKRGPLHRSRLGVWVTPDYAVADKALRDRRFGLRNTDGSKPSPPLTDFDNSFLGMDPPDHSRLRKLAIPSFSPRAITGYRPMVERICADLLDRIDDPGEFDVMRDFAKQVPMAVIGDLFGIPDTHRERFARFGAGVSMLLDGMLTLEQVQELDIAVAGLREVFEDLIAVRDAEPGEDVLSRLLAAREGSTLTTHEVAAMCEMLALAGTETTVNLIGNGILALLDNPEQWELLRENHDLAPGAVEETLRYDTPVQQSNRIVHEDVEVAGQLIAPNEQIVVLTAACNRDPAVHIDPDRFDITRDTGPEHLSFSSGLHYCLGAPLARLEADVALRAVAERFPKLRRTGDVVRRKSPIIRGLNEFPVAAS